MTRRRPRTLVELTQRNIDRAFAEMRPGLIEELRVAIEVAKMNEFLDSLAVAVKED